MLINRLNKKINGNNYLLMGIVLLVCFIVYLPALNSGLMYDDPPNLRGLSQVIDNDSAINFIFNGNAGPLGRPIALASFLINHSDWPDNPYAFKLINLIIHLFNGFLLFIWIDKLVKIINGKPEKTPWIAIFTSAIWLFHPFLAPTHLSIIQRMTSLSSTFMLLGLVMYMHGRSFVFSDNKKALIWMSCSVSFATLLASFTKENGVLLPLYILILESTLLCHFSSITNKKYKLWTIVFLWLPNIIIFIYVIFTWNSIVDGYVVRTFNLEQRLITENIILLEYLYQLIIPNADSSQFHDDYLPSKNFLEPIHTLYSILVWFFILSFSWFYRKKQPIIFFSICWFLGGHILESTVFCLELYFSHRNYLPSISIIFMLCYLTWNSSKNIVLFMRTGLLLYTGLIIFCLSEVTKVWGQPILSSELWSKQNPYSIRANQYSAQTYGLHNNFKKASEMITIAHRNIPNSGIIALQMLQLNCAQKNLTRAMIENIINHSPPYHWNPAMLDIIYKLINLENSKHCPVLIRNDIYRLVLSFTQSSAVTTNAITRAELYFFTAIMYQKDRNLNGSMTHLELATEINPEARYFIFGADNLQTAGLYKEASRYLEIARKHLPGDFFKRKRILKKINNLKKTIAKNRLSK